MTSTAPPTIAFELGVGEFRIVTNEAVYKIKVCQDLVDETAALIRTSAAVMEAAPRGAVTLPDDCSSVFFKEMSREIYDQVGQLARKLSISIEDLPQSGALSSKDLTQSGEELQEAKGQLQEVVQWTEEASMAIMDLADKIQSDMDALKNKIDTLNNLDLSGSPDLDDQEQEEAAPAALATEAEFAAKMDSLMAALKRMMDEKPYQAAPEPAAPPTPPAPAPPAMRKVTVVSFDLEVVFQTLYELCTNESVKEHIKAMWQNKSQAFNENEVAKALSDVSGTVENDDGFYLFPIPIILKTLYSACLVDDYKQTIKKMNQTAASIFLDSTLPVEGQAEEIEVPAPDAPTADAPEMDVEPEELYAAPAEEDPLAEILALAGEAKILGLAAASQPHLSTGGTRTSISLQDRNTIVETSAQANRIINDTAVHLTKILEALSFQDLSGQRIMHIVTLIGEIQVQLLSILVSIDSTIKTHERLPEAPRKDTKRLAQDEVNKMLEKVSAPASDAKLMGPDGENRLDQSAVNDLLAQLGF